MTGLFEYFKTSLTYVNNKPFIILPMMLFMMMAVASDLRELKIKDSLTRPFFYIRVVLLSGIQIIAMQYGNLDLGQGLTAGNLCGAALGGLLILIPAMIMMQPMGGDIKFAATLGLQVGPVGIFWSLIGACLIFYGYAFLTIKNKGRMMIPFAPFIALGFCYTMLFISLLGV